MVKKYVEHFDIGQICESGQCFRMEKRAKGRYGIIAGEKYMEIVQQDNECTFYCEEEAFEKFWKDYFDLDKDYGEYIGKISSKDVYLTNAARAGMGIRILRQDLWEMIVSFLISQQNNITRIRRCIQNICEKYGDQKSDDMGNTYYTFPGPEVLAALGEDDLKECNLGYRSKYVVRSARSVASGEVSLEKIQGLAYREAKQELLKLYGVGEKIADCICLFALHQTEAFPVDTHINQALQKHYSKGFPSQRYLGFQGVIQQYIFYYELTGQE